MSSLEKIKEAFTPERWGRLERQALNHAADLPKLCDILVSTAEERYKGNEAASLYNAANRLLTVLGSTLTSDDLRRFEEALETPSPPAAETPAED